MPFGPHISSAFFMTISYLKTYLSATVDSSNLLSEGNKNEAKQEKEDVDSSYLQEYSMKRNASILIAETTHSLIESSSLIIAVRISTKIIQERHSATFFFCNILQFRSSSFMFGFGRPETLVYLLAPWRSMDFGTGKPDSRFAP